jgi:peptidoglycan/LPS O-acetylase OafA/YrhL
VSLVRRSGRNPESRGDCGGFLLGKVREKIPQLDALRGIAILLVIAHNASLHYGTTSYLHPLLDRGWMGVDLFFVLSGFLISGILLDTKESPNYFRNFYARRVLRIWPLYYCLLAFMFVVLPHVSAAQGVAIFAKSSPWWAYPFFLQNFLLPLSTDAAGPLGVTWSLAIEEQFYLVWPIIVRLLSKRQLAILAIVEIAASPVLRYFLAAHHIHIYANFFCRLDGLMLGAFLAALVRWKDFVRERYIGLALAVLAVATPLAVIMDLRRAEWIVFTFTSLAAGAIVYLAMFWRQNWFQWPLANRFLLFTGTISYGLFLLHKIAFAGVDGLRVNSVLHPFVTLGVIVLGSYVLAIISWNVLEQPCLRLKRYFELRRRSAGAGVRGAEIAGAAAAAHVGQAS